MRKLNFVESFLKGISWRFIAALITMTLTYALTGNATLALTLGLIETSVKLLLFPIHDQAFYLLFKKPNAKIHLVTNGNRIHRKI